MKQYWTKLHEHLTHEKIDSQPKPNLAIKIGLHKHLF